MGTASRLPTELQGLDTTWQRLYEQKFGEMTCVVREAAVLAKSFKELYKCKLANDKQAEPWLTPCVHELAAVHQRIVKEQVAEEPGGVLFLLDGSGSVFQGAAFLASPGPREQHANVSHALADDFQAMTRFVSQTFAALMQANSASQVGCLTWIHVC